MTVRRTAGGRALLGLLPPSLVLAALPIEAAPAPVPLDLRLGVAHSDNIARSPDFAAIAETWYEAGLTGTLNMDRPRFDASLAADIDYRKYSSGDFDDEFIGGANAHAKFDIISDRFVWAAEDVYGQSSIDAFALDTPGNRQSTNYFSTGPQFFVPLGARTRLAVHGTWAKATYEKLVIDSTRKTGSLAIERQTSGATIWRLQGAATRIEFDDRATNSPFDVQDYSIGVHSVGARTTIDAEVGTTVLHDAGTSNSALLAHLTMIRQTSPNSTLNFTAGTEYSDSAQFFRLEQLDMGPGQVLGNATAAADPLRSKYAELTWVHTGGRMTLRVIGDWRRERRDVNTFLDVDRTGVAVSADYLFGALVEGGVFGSYYRDRFVERDGATRDSGFGASLAWRFGPRIRTTVVYLHTQGREVVADASVDENRITLSFSYGLKR
jgi:hypothetical protein